MRFPATRSLVLLLLLGTVGASAQVAPRPAEPAGPAAPTPQAGGPLIVAPPSDGPTPPVAPHVVETPTPARVDIAPHTLPTDVPNRPLTADEAARIALRNQPSLLAARAGIAVQQGRTEQLRSGLMPTLGLGGSYTSVQVLGTEGRSAAVPAGNGTSSGFQFAATVRQLLFDFNHTRDLVRQQTELERVARYSLDRAQSDLALTAKSALYQLAQNTRLVAINEENVANRRGQLALAQARLSSGLGLPADVVRAETAVSEAVGALEVARVNESVARISLALNLGVDPRIPLAAADQAEPPIGTNAVDALVGTALSQRPEILQAQAALRSAEIGVSAARTTNAPNVAGTLGFGSRGELFPPGGDTFSIGVSVNWNPFDGGLTSGRVREARANVDIVRSQLSGAQLQVTSDVSQAFVSMRTAEQRVVTTDTEVTNALEGVRIAEGRFRSGLGIFLDIIDAQNALLTARTNRAAAQLALDQARAALRRAVGTSLGALPAP